VKLTARRLNRATLARQLLLRRERLTVPEAVRRLVALQAQEPASPYLALWSRVADLDPTDVDAAFADDAVVKAQLMRITLHAVHADDHPPFQHAMARSLRASRLSVRRFTETGLSADDLDALAPDLLAFVATPRTGADVDAWISARLGAPAPRAWWAMRTFMPVVHAATGGRWSYGARAAYVAARIPPPTGDPATAVAHLLRRYLEGFGPASADDFAQFTLLRKPVVRATLDALADELVTFEGPDGSVLHDVPGAPLPDDDTPAPPRLLPMWDSSLLAYSDRRRVVSDEHRSLVIRRNGDVLPTILVDGFVTGVWRSVPGGIEVTAFDALPARAWRGLAAEAAALVGFLADRDPHVYRRAAHWWDTLPATEVRLLPA
jgi:hypothetical protein